MSPSLAWPRRMRSGEDGSRVAMETGPPSLAWPQRMRSGENGSCVAMETGQPSLCGPGRAQAHAQWSGWSLGTMEMSGPIPQLVESFRKQKADYSCNSLAGGDSSNIRDINSSVQTNREGEFSSSQHNHQTRK